MSKQAISVTLSPDNLVWLRGRALAEGRVSLSEFLDRLVTRTRAGGAPARPVRSMRGALTGLGTDDIATASATDTHVWAAWELKWDALLEGLDIGVTLPPGASATAGLVRSRSAVRARTVASRGVSRG